MRLFKLLSLAVGVLGIFPLIKAGSISESLLAKLTSGQSKTNAILELPSVMSTVLNNPTLSSLSGADKASLMTTLMKQLTSQSQSPFMSIINQFGAGTKATPFYISNVISMKDVNLPLINALATVPGPFTLREEQIFSGGDIESSPGQNNISSLAARGQWSVEKIEAPAVWDNGIFGEGILIANIDSGVYKDHEALRDNFAGAWKDAVNGQDDQPYDDHGHGTHTMGTICGRSRGIGVAPGATWIACKALDSLNRGSEQSLLSCGQWIFEQRPLPHVVCNSWGGDRGGNTWYNNVISSWRSVGIIPVFSIGNDGNQCGTARSPGDQDNLISVGNTDINDVVARTSSRGPAVRSRKTKPEVSAPGENVWSASNNGDTQYRSFSGTSMAAPHVTGAIALMLQANPGLQFNDILLTLTRSADRPKASKADLKCEPSNSKTTYPNNAYGYGRINVRKAIDSFS